MKKFRKIMAVLVAAMMVVAMAVPAWAATDHTLTLDLNDGTATTTVDNLGTYNFSSYGTVPARIVNGVNVQFIGWTESKQDILSAADTVPPGTRYTNSDSVTLSADKTLYGLWGYNYNGNNVADIADVEAGGTAITVSFDGRDGENIPDDFSTAIINGNSSATVTLSSTKPTKAGKEFLGWETTNTNTTSIGAGGNVPANLIQPGATGVELSNNTTFYAVWGDDNNGNGIADVNDALHTITFDNNKTVEWNGLERQIQGVTEPIVAATASKRTGDDYVLPTPTDGYGYIYDEVRDETVYVAFMGWTTDETKSKILHTPKTTPVVATKEIIVTDAEVTYYPLWGYATAADTAAQVETNATNGTGDTIKIETKAVPAKGTALPETHTVWKIFDVTKTSANASWEQNDINVGSTTLPTGFAYTIKSTDAWYLVVSDDSTEVSTYGKATDYVKLTPTADGVTYIVEWKGDATEERVKAFAKILENGKAGKPSSTISSNDVLYTKPGYYLIDSTLGTNLILATSNIKLSTKNDYIDDDKQVLKTSTTVGGQNNNDFATFFIKLDIPASVRVGDTIVIHDVMDDQLEYIASSLKMTEALTSYTETTAEKYNEKEYNNLITGVVSDVAVGKNDFNITITAQESMIGRTLLFKYQAELKRGATASGVYTNTVQSTLHNYTTIEKVANVKTYDFQIEKQDENNSATKLAGAVFELRKDPYDDADTIKFKGTNYFEDATYTKPITVPTQTTPYYGALGTAEVADSDDTAATTTNQIVTGTDGLIHIIGLGAGTYHLREIKAPEGYMLPTSDIVITITEAGTVSWTGGTAATGSETSGAGTVPNIVVPNKTSTLLPSTGGMGTTVLYIVGGMLVILAGAYLFFSRRRQA